jgi:hypothetical protein
MQNEPTTPSTTFSISPVACGEFSDHNRSASLGMNMQNEAKTVLNDFQPFHLLPWCFPSYQSWLFHSSTMQRDAALCSAMRRNAALCIVRERTCKTNPTAKTTAAMDRYLSSNLHHFPRMQRNAALCGAVQRRETQCKTKPM